VRRGETILVACSGGPDSTALAHVLHALRDTLQISLVVASVDHGLRPESKDEVARVGRFASSLGLPFVPLEVVVRAGDSLHAAAREARYAALFAAARDARASKVAVGHTQNDQAETVIDRLLRGAGIRGLAGIDPHREDGVVRPLIDVSRADVERYVARHGLPVERDPSNEMARFRRVRVRNELLPAMVLESPAVVSHLADLADEARATIALLDAQTPHIAGDALPLASLQGRALPERLATLRKFALNLAGSPPGRAHIEALSALVDKGGEVWLRAGVRVTRTEEALVADRSLQHSGRSVRRSKSTDRSQIPEPEESEGSQD
jgi:tRNA(Ile)-lysidine synthase